MPRVIVVGVIRNQVTELRRRLPEIVQLRAVESRRALRVGRLGADLVLCTRFLGHKHQRHLQCVCNAPVIFCPGGISQWVERIIRWVNQDAPRKVGRAC